MYPRSQKRESKGDEKGRKGKQRGGGVLERKGFATHPYSHRDRKRMISECERERESVCVCAC